MLKLIAYSFFGLILALNAQAKSPEKIQLGEFTQVTVYMYKSLGVRLIFPFVLTNEELQPALIYTLSNNSLFHLQTPQEIMGRNTLTIKKMEGVSSGEATLHLSVDGYNLTVLLKTTDDRSKYKTDVFFDVPQERKDLLLEKIAETEKKRLQALREAQMEALNAKVNDKAMLLFSDLIQEGAEKHYIKEESEHELDDKGVLNFYVERIDNYSDKVYVMHLEIANKSGDNVRIKNFTLTDGNKQVISGEFSCLETIRADEAKNCVFVTGIHSITDSKKLIFDVSTDRGNFSKTY